MLNMPSSRSRSLLLEAALLLGSLQYALAQTSSDCNPVVNTTIQCPADPAFATSHTWNFNTTDAPSTDLWTVTAGTVDWTADGANFTIREKGDSPTIRSEFYIFGGRVEIWMKAAAGQGIVSSVMMLSDDLDEIDSEFIGSDGTNVQANYFGKGVGNYTWMTKETVEGGAFDDFHNYTVYWTDTSLEWWIDGTLKRTLLPAEANNSYYYPQTPMRVYIGPWAGGDPDNAKGTIEWAGGETDYTKGPFTMAVKSISVTDFGKGVSYNYTDSSGSWDSIEMLEYVLLFPHDVRLPRNKSLTAALLPGPKRTPQLLKPSPVTRLPHNLSRRSSTPCQPAPRVQSPPAAQLPSSALLPTPCFSVTASASVVLPRPPLPRSVWMTSAWSWRATRLVASTQMDLRSRLLSTTSRRV